RVRRGRLALRVRRRARLRLTVRRAGGGRARVISKTLRPCRTYRFRLRSRSGRATVRLRRGGRTVARRTLRF
ncbi:MAG TPA: hypothetical protein VF533_09360, partial [Solirubrobacteraceae bacterium]